MARLALDGVRVLDLSDNVAGAYASRLFAVVGADVVVVEPLGGSPLRQAPPLISTPRAGRRPESGAFAYLHAYKRSVALNIGDASGRSAMVRLVARADLVISSFDGTPDIALARDVWLRAANPGLVHAVVSGYGLTGLKRRWVSSDLTDWASSGHLYITGFPEREPLQGGGPWAGYAAGLTTAVGALSAMLGARASGKGRLVDVGTMEALAGLHQWSLVHFTHQGVIKQRGGNRHVESFHPMGLQQVKDGWVVLGVSTQAQYESMCIAMELPELITDERFLTGGHRVDHGEEFDALIAPWLRARTRAEVVEAFQAARVPSGKVLTLDETLADPQLEARALWVTPERFGLRAKMPGVPFAIGGERPLFREAPQFAADTLAVLLEAGMAPAEIDKLIAEGVAAARTEVEA